MPNWKGQFVEIKGTIDGPVYDFTTKDVQIRHQSTTVNFDGKIKNILDEDTRSLEVNLKIDAAENTASIPFTLSAEVSKFLMRLDDFSTDAKVILHDKLWNVKADLITAIGRMQSNASFALDSKVSDFSINLASDDFDIGKLTAVPTIGRT